MPLSPLSTGSLRIRSSRRIAVLPWAVLAVTLAATALLALHEARSSEREAAVRLEAHARETADRIAAHMQGYEQMLRGTAGLFADSDGVSRREFHDYVASLGLDKNNRGIQAVGYVELIPAAELDHHQAAVRAEGFPEYAVHPPGQRDLWSTILYIEPFAGRNLRAFGFDLLSEPERRATAEHARDCGCPSLTGRLTLQQDGPAAAEVGTVMMLPVYRGVVAPESLAARREALRGWVFGTFRMGDLLVGTLEDEAHDDLAIFDGETISRANLLYESSAADAPGSLLAASPWVERIDIAGRTWTLAIGPHSHLLGRPNAGRTAGVALIGLLGSLLMTALTWALVRSRRLAFDAADAIRRNEARVRAVFRLPLVGFALSDPEKGWLEVNDRFCEMLGYTRREIALTNWAQLTHPEDVAADVAQFERVVAGEIDTYSLEKRYLRRDGSILWALLSVGCVRKADGGVDFLIALLTDISDRKAVEAELQRESDMLREAEQIGQVGSFEKDLASGLLTASEQFLGIHGMHRGMRMDSRTLRELTHPEDAARVEESWNAAHGRLGRFEIEHRILRPQDGAVRCIHVRAMTIPGPTGDPARVVGVAQDVTERREAEEKVLALNRELESRVAARTAELRAALGEMESFSYSVAHDLRAPVRAIDGYATLLAEELAEPRFSEARRLLEALRLSSRRMGRLIDDLLEFSRTGRLELRREAVDMQALARRVLDECLPAKGRERYEVQLRDLPQATGDSRLIEVLLRNLVANAVKFSAPREQPQIEIGSRDGGGVAEYFVRDNGVGFDQAYAHKLFGVFQRLHGAREFEGTGIGLALVGRIVGRHGGRVRAEGRVDHGATFSFTLAP